MEADERRALEAELAAELAALLDGDSDDSDSDDMDDDTSNDGYTRTHHSSSLSSVSDTCSRASERRRDASDERYVRLDLEQLLLRVASDTYESQLPPTASQDATASPAPSAFSSSSWALLRASVEKSDADFFQFIQRDLDDLQTTAWTVAPSTTPLPSAAAAAAAASASAIDISNTIATTTTTSSTTTAAEEKSVDCSDTIDDPQTLPITTRLLSIDSDDVAATSSFDTPEIDTAPLILSSSPASTIKSSSARAVVQSSPPRPTALPIEPSPLPLASERERERELALALERETQAQLQHIHAQYAARQRRVQRLQDAQQLARAQTTKQMQALEATAAAFDAAQQQAHECTQMQREDALASSIRDAFQQAVALAAMALEDAASRAVDAALHALVQHQQRETSAMRVEEQRERLCMRLDAERVQREQLVQAQCLLRRLFVAVMHELVAVHNARAAAQQRVHDAARRREGRETTLMRSEELVQRRVLAKQRAFEDTQRKTRERLAMAIEDAASQAVATATSRCIAHEVHAMAIEDALACAVRTAATQLVMDHQRLLMAREEELSQRAHVFALQNERQRVTQCEALRKLLQHRVRIAFVRLALAQWRTVVAYQQSIETNAATQLQRCYRQYRVHCLLHINEHASATTAAAAARVVQSTFRGFSIRRKFANALAIAKLVDLDDSDRDATLDEVHLEDLIALPPELADGWENPVLPLRRNEWHLIDSERRRRSRQDAQPEDHSDVEDDEEESVVVVEEEEEEERRDRVDRIHMSSDSDASSAAAASAVSQIVGATSPLAQLPPVAAPSPPATLASALWDKMRKMKQKQRHVADERVRAQDPTYRLEKLLKTNDKKFSSHSSSSSSNNNHSHNNGAAHATAAPTIAWGSSNSNSSSSDKKKPKVKVPSLVERLRKKTEAAR